MPGTQHGMPSAFLADAGHSLLEEPAMPNSQLCSIGLTAVHSRLGKDSREPINRGGDDAATLSRRKIRHSPKPQMSGGRKFTSVSDSNLREVTLT